MTNSRDLPLLIFDLDGTLIHSAPDIHIALNQMLKKYSRPLVDLVTLTSHIGDGLKKLVHDFFPEFEPQSPQHLAKVDEFLELYRDEYLTHMTVLYPEVFEFLRDYKGPKALVTNKDIVPTRHIFRHFGLDQLNWVAIIGGDSLSEKKPSPLPLLTVMKKINYPPANTWMIGDGRPDMKSAHSAGCLKVAVHYGYSHPDELSLFNPDHTLTRFSDLKLLLK